MEEEYKLKMAAISGASHALKYKEKHPQASGEEVIRYVTQCAEEIVSKIDKE